MRQYLIEFTGAVDRTFYWTDVDRHHVRTVVYRVGDVEIHVPYADGHIVELRLPSGEAHEIGVVREVTRNE